MSYTELEIQSNLSTDRDSYAEDAICACQNLNIMNLGWKLPDIRLRSAFLLVANYTAVFDLATHGLRLLVFTH